MKYRNDIQILKGYAILIIVFYHLDYLKHGYIAVLIFITISGYLSTSVNSIIRIFKRYIRLIAPCVTNIFVIIIIYNKNIPQEQFFSICNEIICTLLMCINYYFIYNSSDYFNPPENSLFLHYWYLAVNFQIYIISLYLNNKYSAILLFAVSLFLFIYTFYKSISYFYFASIPRLWEYLFPKIMKYEAKSRIVKILAFITLFTITLYHSEIMDERIYHLIIVLATYLYLIVSVNINIYILEIIGKLSYYIYLVHYPVIKLESFNPNCLYIMTVVCILQYIVYGENPILFISKYKYFFLLMLLIQSHVILHIVIGSILYGDKENYYIGDIHSIKIINRYNYCCFMISNSIHDKKVLFVGDSHVFNIMGNYYNILKNYEYLIYYKYIHTEFIIKNNSDLYDISNYYHIIINMNLFYDNKHKEYLKMYPQRIWTYLYYLKSKSYHVLYLTPTPVLKKKVSCKNQIKYIAHNRIDIMIYKNKIKQRNGIIIYDLSSLFCNNDACNLSYKGKCIFADEHHFTINFYVSISNFTFKTIIGLLNLSYTHRNNVGCEYILHKNKILRAWNFPYKGCKLHLYF